MWSLRPACRIDYLDVALTRTKSVRTEGPRQRRPTWSLLARRSRDPARHWPETRAPTSHSSRGHRHGVAQRADLADRHALKPDVLTTAAGEFMLGRLCWRIARASVTSSL